MASCEYPEYPKYHRLYAMPAHSRTKPAQLSAVLAAACDGVCRSTHVCLAVAVIRQSRVIVAWTCVTRVICGTTRVDCTGRACCLLYAVQCGASQSSAVQRIRKHCCLADRMIFLFSSWAIVGVGESAQAVVKEVRRQFKEEPGTSSGPCRWNHTPTRLAQVVTSGYHRSSLL